jgi:hypothetical protein
MVARALVDTSGERLTIARGTSPILTFNVIDKFTGETKNLTGAAECTFVLAAYSSASARDLVLTLGDGVAHNGVGGTVTVSLTTAKTEALPLGHNRWAELHLTDSQGRRDVIGGYCDVVDTLTTVP